MTNLTLFAAGLDYRCLPGIELTFSSSSTTVLFSVDIMDDGLTELSEFFEAFVGLSMGGNCLSLETQESNRIKFARNQTQIVILYSDSESPFSDCYFQALFTT